MVSITDFPLIPSGYVVAALAVGPLLPVCIGLFFVFRSNTLPEGHKHSIVHNIAYLLKHYAPVFVVLNLLWSLLLSSFQGLYVYHNLELGGDITYYMKVNLPAYESMDNINSASSLNSLNIAMMNGRRRLGYGSTLSIIYHNSDWDNMLTEDRLVSICQTEHNIRQLDCINLYESKSMIQTTFDSNCNYLTSYQEALPEYGLSENSPYVADNTSPTDPKSDILISFFAMGTCGDMTPTDFGKLLDSTNVDGVQTTFVSNDFTATEFKDAIFDAAYWSVASLILCIGFLILGVQGMVIATTTLVCIIISVVNAAAILPYWDYGSFSAFNVMSLFILLGVGANAVLMFGSAWRRVVPSGMQASVDNIVESYEVVSQSVLFTTCAALLSLFSKLASPVIVISQLGAFMGMAVTVFYICFHTIILPMWVFTSWFHMPAKMRRWLDRLKLRCWAFVCCRAYDPEEVRRSRALTHSTLAAAGTASGEQGGYLGVPFIEPKSDHTMEPYESVNVPQRGGGECKDSAADAAGGCENFRNGRQISSSSNRSSSTGGAGVLGLLGSPFATTQPSIMPVSHSSGDASAGGRQRSVSGLESQFVVAPKDVVTPTSRNSSDSGDPNEPSERQQQGSWLYRACCNAKTPLRLLGLIVFLLVLFGLFLVYYFTTAKLTIDFGIPQLFVPSSNIGQCMYIVKNYKSDVFTMQASEVDLQPTSAPVVKPPSKSPTLAPTKVPSITLYPSVVPTRSPSHSPTYTVTRSPTRAETDAPTTYQPSAAPVITVQPTNTAVPTNTNSPTNTQSPTNTPQPTNTASPTATVAPTFAATQTPTVVPSLRPTNSPTTTHAPTNPTPTAAPMAKYAEYTVTGCWGIHAHKDHIDSDAVLTFDSKSFKAYSDGDLVDGQFINSGLLTDMQTTCDYIDNNRDHLNVSPDWNKDVDCIYAQYLQASQSDYWNKPNAPPYTVENIMIYWGAQDYISGTLIGVEGNVTSIQPVWVCVNVSARTYGVDSLVDDTALAITLLNRWDDAFKNTGSQQADKFGIPSVVGSDEFTFPILAQEVFFSIELAAIISVAGFVGLLLLFTKADIGLTVLGTLGMLTIIAVSLCLHVYFFPGDFDLLDIVVLIAIMGMAVDFPIHLIVEFVAARYNQEMSIKTLTNGDDETDSVVRGGGTGADEDDALVTTDCAADAVTSPHQPQPYGYRTTLKETQTYIALALIAPLILTILSGVPLLRAEFQLIRKSGQYIVILAVVSYTITVLFLPFLMPLGCRIPLCERVCLGSQKQQEQNLQLRESEHSAQRLSEIRMQEEEDAEEERELQQQHADTIAYRSDARRRSSSNRMSSGVNEIGSSHEASAASTADEVIVVPIRVLLNQEGVGPLTPLIVQDADDHA